MMQSRYSVLRACYSELQRVTRALRACHNVLQLVTACYSVLRRVTGVLLLVIRVTACYKGVTAVARGGTQLWGSESDAA